MTNDISSYGLEFRQFNRFYTKVLGFLHEHIYDSPFSLTEIRVIFELYHTNNCTAKVLQENLNLDRGYMSRILKRFEKEGMISKQKCNDDGRNHLISLTTFGHTIYKKLEEKANQQVDYILNDLEIEGREKLVNSMKTIENILSHHLHPKEPVVSIRDYYLSEDVQTMIERQRVFYAESHEWDETFSEYLEETFDSDIEKIWIAESGGKFVGCVGLVKYDEKTVQLRWFLVEGSFRQKGVGTQLLQTLVDYCREQEYERVFLWTASNMLTARPLYQKFGFEISHVKEARLLWGQNLVEERWDLEL
ncbi:bifunctional helix-turn-helix transcriptional regulator/GNAT family N-acetyltransferase [Risungbinella massiliensis]|uniref:bifunctional helix-turn-helix transcriptional regulator/GNAT family N-acetyltransferase n=1 Tax=Risungbinella massiliensis TaxID=1329796 RepID=UPI0005CBE498|nr:helix-turn-helix domain-containing GNAT family N-acetyltransferase [Risungbinella massiliensis]